MRMTAEGLDLIKRFEGCRTKAYRCPSGVWTIGYGHTSAAGRPRVDGGLEITMEDASDILARDAATFADGVSAALRVDVSDRQFSALVSFAYNVGLANFQSSSALKAINDGDMAAVPRRLQLWNRAGGKILPGLVRRRAAEAELFVNEHDESAAVVEPGSVTRQPGKPLRRSTTALAAILAALAGIGPALAPLFGMAVNWPVSIFLLLAIAAATAWILRERIRKSMEESV